ncbi:MAG: hypothetical protein K2L03_00635, partial [Bacteroidales bacterium]|nr:hypothetical protein [Bacteroidales bacterium]
GGIIPGGIFIEQAPEAAQFEPLYDANVQAKNTAFCPGDNVQLIAKVKFPSGKAPGGYNVQLWPDYEWDPVTNKPTGGLPRVELKANTGTHASNNGFTLDLLDETADAQGLHTYIIKMTKAAFGSISFDALSGGNTEFKKKFRIVIQEDGADTKPGTAVTTAEYLNVPRFYLNVAPDNEQAVGAELGYDRTAGTPDKITSIVTGTKIMLRNDCDLHMTSSNIRMNCYYQGASDNGKFSSQLFASSAFNGVYSEVPGATTGVVLDMMRTIATLGEDPIYYFNKLTWKNGCVFATDTVLIEPRGDLAAPDLNVFTDCLNLYNDDNPFWMQAKAPEGIDVEEWQWVFRAEDNGEPEEDRHAGNDYYHPKQGNPCGGDYSFAEGENNVPLTQTSDKFGGGCYFTVPTGHSEIQIDNSFGSDENDIIKAQLTFDNAGLISTFKVSRTAGGVYAYPTIMGQWLPVDASSVKAGQKYVTILPVGSGASGTWNDYALQSAAETKYVYVRYKTAYGYSPWAIKLTGISSACEALEEMPIFGVTVKNDITHCPGSQASKSTDFFPCKTCSTDTNVDKGAKLQFYFTVFAEPKCSFYLYEGESIQWEATDEDGNVDVFATLTGDNPDGDEYTWPKDAIRAYSCHDDYGMIMIPAPKLYTMTKKKVKVRTSFTDPNGVRVYSGFFPGSDGSGWLSDCLGEASFDVSDGTDKLNDEYVEVSTEPKAGEVKAKRDNGVTVVDLADNKAMCVGDKLELDLSNMDLTATWEWDSSSDGVTWNSTGVTDGSFTYVPDKSIFMGLSTPGKVTKYFRCRVTIDGEEITDDEKLYFSVNVFWAEKLIVGSTGVSPAVALRPDGTGVCEGTNVTMTGTPQDNKGSYNDQELEYEEDGVWTLDSGNKPAKSGKNASVTFEVSEEYFDNVPMRFKSIYKTNMDGYTCSTYSDTVTLKVNKLEKGEIKTNESDGKLCAKQPNQLTYDGPGDSIAWFSPSTAAKPTATGRTVTITPSGEKNTTWTIKVRAISGKGQYACVEEVSKTFTLKDCEVTLSVDPADFCVNNKPADGVTLTLGMPYAVEALYVSTDDWTTSTTLTAGTDYTATTAATDGKIKLTATYVSGLAVGKYRFSADITMNGNTVPTQDGILTVNPLPTLSNLTTTTNGAVCEKDDLTFETPATATGGDLSYQWYYAATQAAANAHTGTAVTADANTSGHTAKKLTLKTTGLSSTLNGRWYYAKV